MSALHGGMSKHDGAGWAAWDLGLIMRRCVQITNGKAKYDATKNELVWKVKRFTGQTEHSLSAEVELVATTAERAAWSKPPIKMDFQVPMFSASGLRVQYLKVWEKSSYKVDKWVRKISKSGDYDIRM